CVQHALDATERLGVAVKQHVLGPATHGTQLDEAIARGGDPLERLLEAVSVVAVGMAAQPILQCHSRLPPLPLLRSPSIAGLKKPARHYRPAELEATEPHREDQ